MRTIFMAFAVAAHMGASASAAEPVISCRAIGMTAEQGETLCIRTNEGMRRARCGMVLNVSSWTFIDEPCEAAAKVEENPSEDDQTEPVPQQ